MGDGSADARPLKPAFGAPGSTVNRILQAAWLTAGRKGPRKLSISVICKAANVSRATFYRHFATKDEVLKVLSDFVSYSFIEGLREAATRSTDPIEVLHDVLSFHWRLTQEEQTSGMMDVEPEYVVGFLRTHFEAHVEAMTEALEPVFDYVDAKRRTKLNRRQVAESLIRLGLSTVLIPSESGWESIPGVLLGLVDNPFESDGLTEPRLRAVARAGGLRAAE